MSCATSATLHPLITQNLVDTKKFYCPFLERGFCRDNTKCNFSHDLDGSIKVPNDYCHFYLANQCLYGFDCKFRHVEPSLESSSTITPSSNTSSSSSSTTTKDISNIKGTSVDPTTSNTLLYPYTTAYWPQGERYLQPSYDYSTHDFQNFMTQGDNHDDYQPIEQISSFERMSYRFSSSLPALCHSDYATHNQDEPDPPLIHHQSIGHIDVLSSDLLLLICDLCGRPCLKPHDLEQQSQHRDECLREHEREMELSFAIQRSRDKVCGICMDIVVEKKPITSSRFGILEKCNHIFCLDCIRKWRGTKQFETRTIRACPECRTCSDFVVPSKYWVEEKDDKEKLIHDYKAALQSKPCKYFNEGRGDCPFAGSCFYKHAYPDGRIAKLDNPKPRRRYHSSRNASVATDFILWRLLTSTDDDDDNEDEDEVDYDDDIDSERTSDFRDYDRDYDEEISTEEEEDEDGDEDNNEEEEDMNMIHL